MRPGLYGFKEEDVLELDANKSYLSVGSYKTTRFIEGPKGPGKSSTAVVMAVKKTAFHATINVVEKAKCYVDNLEQLSSEDYSKLNKAFKG